MIGRSIIWVLNLSFALPGVLHAQTTKAPVMKEISSRLESRRTGADTRYDGLLRPAQSLASNPSSNEREMLADQRITNEIHAVLTAFRSAPAAVRVGIVRAKVAEFDKETANDGAARKFEGRGPSLSVMRQVFFVQANAVADPKPVARVMDAISSFERSPKPEDIYYFYSNPLSALNSVVTEARGTSDSYLGRASARMVESRPETVKKCRRLLGSWYCNTSVYEVVELSTGKKSEEPAQALLTSLFALDRAGDAPIFRGDGRTQNIVDGYTSVYLVYREGDLILVYNIGLQHRPDSPGFQSRLNEGHKTEYRQLLQRLQLEFGPKSTLTL